MEFPNIYKGNYKLLILAPIILILVSLYFIPQIPQGVDFKGGILITLQTNQTADEDAIKSKLAEIGITDATVSSYSNPLGNIVEVQIEQNERLAENEQKSKVFGTKVDEVLSLEASEFSILQRIGATTSDSEKQRLNADLEILRANLTSKKSEMQEIGEAILRNSESFVGFIPRNSTSTKGYGDLVENSISKARETYRQNIITALGKVVSYSTYSFQDVSPTLSEFFLQKVSFIVIVSAILTILVVFAVFRSIVPSVAVLAGALTDVIIALGAMGLFHIPLTLPSFAALLMLVGFSLDTDMLLTIRTMKRAENSPRDRAYEAMKTGTTMTFAAIASFTVLFVLSLLVHIPTYFLIASVAIAGLIGDLFATWMFNGVIILWYLEGKGEK
ncbi:hypothetical protein HY570_02445 [Candidatus Micrarchaeota archaeon]|nr:hypothetical protein [Candidatus Micrarchaeota archaeon]